MTVQLSPILRGSTDNGILFKCPACDMVHKIHHGSGSGPRWTFNGDVTKPTFSPSVLVTWTEPSDTPEEFDDHTKDIKKICHSFVTDGRIQFLGDCTHALAGQTVDLPEWSWD